MRGRGRPGERTTATDSCSRHKRVGRRGGQLRPRALGPSHLRPAQPAFSPRAPAPVARPYQRQGPTTWIFIPVRPAEAPAEGVHPQGGGHTQIRPDRRRQTPGHVLRQALRPGDHALPGSPRPGAPREHLPAEPSRPRLVTARRAPRRLHSRRSDRGPKRDTSVQTASTPPLLRPSPSTGSMSRLNTYVLTSKVSDPQHGTAASCQLQRGFRPTNVCANPFCG